MLILADSAEYFAHDRSTVAAFAVLATIALTVGLLSRHRPGALTATGLALAAVLSLTLPPAGGWHELATARWDLSAPLSALRPTARSWWAWRSGTDGPLNVVLFLPLGACCTWLLRRPAVALAACVTLSLAIETYQAASGLRVGSASDVVSNGLGALIGVLLAAVALGVLAACRTTAPHDRMTAH